MLMRRLLCVFLLLFSTSVLILPDYAEARAGGGRTSSGSRGTRTYSTPSQGTQPIQRSTTAAPASNPSAQPQPAMMPPTGGSPFWRGLAGGFLGAGLASMLFGGMGGFGGGGGGMGLLPILLMVGVGYFLYKRFKNSAGGMSSGFVPPAYGVAQGVNNVGQPLTVTDQDKAEFEQLLYKIQYKWSEGDISGLRQNVTPEMLQYFNEELATNTSKGLANKVEQVKLQHAEVTEAWSEYGVDYATASLQWVALDYMVRLDRQNSNPDYVAEGSLTQFDNVTEVWTFMRAPGGNWLLSAIQQVA